MIDPTLKRMAAQAREIIVKNRNPKDVRFCTTYLCNWEGLTILGDRCPVCGNKLRRKAK